MIKFEKRYLYTFADVERAKALIGKKGISFDCMITDDGIRHKELTTLDGVVRDTCRWYKCGRHLYEYFYYDPNLEVKRAYYLDGKKIQWRDIFSEDWKDCNEEPYWSDTIEYRVKPDKCDIPLTNYQVHEWLAKGNGQALLRGNVMIHYTYDNGDDDRPFPYHIRKWNDSEWHEATEEYISKDE